MHYMHWQHFHLPQCNFHSNILEFNTQLKSNCFQWNNHRCSTLSIVILFMTCTESRTSGWLSLVRLLVKGWLVGWGLTALSTQFWSYCAFNVELYYKKYKNLIGINSWSKITEKKIKYNNNSRFRLNQKVVIR